MTNEKKEEKFVVALELGSSRAKIGIAGFNPNDKTDNLTVYATETLPTLDSIRYGRITNIREVTDMVASLVYELDGKYPIEGRTISGIIVSVGGRTLRSQRISSQIVLPERREITEELVARLRDEAVQNLSTPGEIICVEPVSYEVDNLINPRPVGSLGTRLKGEFTAVVCHPSNKTDLIDVVDNRAKLNISGLTVQPIALANLVLSPQETNAGCMLVDFGAETITVAIYKKYALQYLVTIPIGSRLITRDLATTLSLTEEEAEELKINMGDAMPDGGTFDSASHEALNAVVCTRLCDIIANISAQPGFAQIKSLPAGIVLAGGGSRLRNFARLLASTTGYKVRMATLPPEIIITDTAQSSTDNLDLIALLKEGADIMRQDPDAVCVEPLKTSGKSKQPVFNDVPSYEEDVFIDLTGSGQQHSRGPVSYGEEQKSTKPVGKKNTMSSETEYKDYTVADDEESRWEVIDNREESEIIQTLAEREAANKKAEAAQKQAKIEADAAERERKRREKEEKKLNKVTGFDRIMNRFGRIFQGSSEDNSKDMDE